MGDFKRVLRELRTQYNLTQDALATKLGTSKSTISMYENGKREPDFETLEAIADFFNVDMNYLLGKSDTTTMLTSNNSTWSPTLNHRDMKEIDQIIANTMELLQQDGLMFDGKPADEEDIQSIISAMEIGLEMAKKKSKEKFTPKKYRK